MQVKYIQVPLTQQEVTQQQTTQEKVTQQKAVNQFFKRYKTNVSCHSRDLVFYAENGFHGIVAAVLLRLIPNTDKYLLRSLYVAPEYRSKGIARALCEFVLLNHGESCWTLCKPELADFYQSLGFIVTTQAPVSTAVEKQIKKGLILMIRP